MIPVVTFWNQAPRDYFDGKLTNEQLKDVPCAYWLKAAREAGWLNATECKERIERGDDPKSFALISEERNADSEALLALGVTPLICLSFESPLYVPEFYGDREWRKRFKHDWSPMPFVPMENYDFLSKSVWQLQPTKGQGVCAFASGKHWAELRGPWDNPTFSEAFGFQLLQRRWMEYYYRAKVKTLTLYGRGWTPRQLPGLPADFWDVITPCVREASPYSEKFNQMRAHKSVLSIENYSLYATEKAYDFQAAGMEGVYIGAQHWEARPIISEVNDLIDSFKRVL